MTTKERATREQVPSEQVSAGQRWLVQSSWEKIAPLAPHVAELFYDRLFELDPLLEDSFPSNLSEQCTQLMSALGLAVARLDDPRSIPPCLEELGKRHVAYGVRRADYVTMGSALLWTLEQSLAEDFTPRMQDAWAAVYELLAALLIEAAETARNDREQASGLRPLPARALAARRVV
jgi:hemoglobin-like flavoprotein